VTRKIIKRIETNQIHTSVSCDLSQVFNDMVSLPRHDVACP
jgi:hypothetical protein